MRIHNFFGFNVFCNNSSKLVLFQRQEDSCDKLFAKVRRQTSPAGMQGKIGHRGRVCCQKKDASRQISQICLQGTLLRQYTGMLILQQLSGFHDQESKQLQNFQTLLNCKLNTYDLPYSGEFLGALPSKKSTFCQKITVYKDQKSPS